MIIASLLLAAAPQEPPRTVNGIVLGRVEDFADAGPTRICLERTAIDVEEGETAYLEYLGIHYGVVRLVGPRGTLQVNEGDSWGQSERGSEIEDRYGRLVRRYRDKEGTGYVIYERAAFNPHEETPVVSLRGDALGKGRDRSFLARIVTGGDRPSGCRRVYDYGWDLFLGKPEEEDD